MSNINDFIILNGVLTKYNGTDSDVVIPDNVTSIGNAFEWCESLTDITIPDSVTTIDKSAFYKCLNLTIKCSAGSYAESFAKVNSIPFETE